MCASHMGLEISRRRMKVQAAEVGRFGIPVSLAGGAPRRPAALHLGKWRSFSSAHVGTRKMRELCPDQDETEETLVEGP
ncbi:hypothetical protein JTE90_006516 [Oedothorax gibbosus]|uniref:Uncharacterized protein n=1 Tax=Oedothorax gibbosus TaxID=931172 RepID=A0AAV6THJ5_9ARAC|nr:hypothetical protein JTE90_006516 [Oedothorax gibbosus]